jgi:1,4-dihydroxy-2-naphthoyl-CoA hydrolase
MIWKNKLGESELQRFQSGTMAEHLGLKILEIGEDFILGEMPINEKTIQPFGILHGGASAALSESMGSVASYLCIDLENEIPVGIEINANHLYQGKGKKVLAKTTPIRIGSRIHVWNTEIFDEEKRLLCVSRLTVMIIKQKKSND